MGGLNHYARGLMYLGVAEFFGNSEVSVEVSFLVDTS